MDPSRCYRAAGRAGQWRRAAVSSVLVVVLGACASAPQRAVVGQNPAGECASLFARDDARILHAGVRDAEYRAIEGHPYLRIDRFHAALTPRLDDPAARAAWLGRLAALDTTSRRIEYRNLAPDQRRGTQEITRLEACAQHAITTLLADDDAFRSLLARAGIGDNYSAVRRVVGLYPLAAPFALRGVARLQARENRHFTAAALSKPAPADGAVYGFADPEPPDGLAERVRHVPRDALGIPVPDAATLARLFAAHSPVFALDADGAADRIGHLHAGAATIQVDPADPVVYTYASHTMFEGTVLLQLNYVVWFPARAARSRFDIYAGPLDGITWRVTLDSDGSVLLADTMHNCGCYYMAFPGHALAPRTGVGEFAEPLWVPQTLPPAGDGRFVIQLSGGEHYVRGIRAMNAAQSITPLRVVPYAALKNLPLPGSDITRNAFAPDGLIHDSARAERFLLWPFGIRSAGAMREAGHHAIAFVGNRHFDDPDLLDRYFVRAAPSSREASSTQRPPRFSSSIN